MSTKSFTLLRRFSGYALVLLLFCVGFGRDAGAQATAPPVVPSFASGLTHPSGWSTIEQTAVDNYGDWLVVDYLNEALYEFPAGGGALITLAGPASLDGIKTYHNPGLAIDPTTNNLYLEGNYNNCILMFPWDAGAKTWDGLSTLSATNTTTDICPNGGGGTSPYIFAQYSLTISSTPGDYPGYFQPWGMAVETNGTIVVGSQNASNVAGSKGFIFTLGVQGTGPAVTATETGQMILDSMTERPNSIAVDPAGDIFFVEDTGGLSGAYEIPAGTPEVATDTDPSILRVDPMLPNVTGVSTDPQGNLYISDGTDGVYMIPFVSGAPNTAGIIRLTPVPAQGEAAADTLEGILYVPTTQVQSNGEADVAKVTFNAAQFGSTAAGTPATTQAVDFNFNAAVAAGLYTIEEAGATTPDFTIASGGTCEAPPKAIWTKLSSCSVNVVFTPHSAGTVTAKLVMLNPAKNPVASLTLNGTGTGSSVQVTPAGTSTIGSGLKTPSQVAVDAAGNVYVADSGQTSILEYPKGSSTATAIGTGLTAPTGVAVDGAGDVFIADSGNVIEVPNTPTGLNAAGQVTLRPNLGSNLKLATDGLNNLYVTDPDNGRVVELENIGGPFNLQSQTENDITGFTAPSALATDESGNLYVADGSKLIEVTTAGVKSTLLNSLNNATGLAVDPSGTVYVAESGGTMRIPDEGGTLTPADATAIAASVSDPTSVALDAAGDVYVTDGTAGDVVFVNSSGSFDFGTLTSTTGTASQDFSILNAGNAPLNISSFAGTADYSETATTCTAAVSPGMTCSATIVFNPGPGDQGSLPGEVLIQGDEANAPAGINAIGVGAGLAGSTTTATIGSASVDGIPVSVTVAPTTASSTTPTGTVTLTMSTTGAAPIVVTGTLGSDGTVQFDPMQVPAGAYTFTIAYQGDRVYGTSSVTANVTVAPGAVTLVQPSMTQVMQDHPEYPYVLSSSGNQFEPYDGSQDPWNYTYTVQVVATDGLPLLAQPVYDSSGKLVDENYGSVTFQGAPYNALSGTGCAPIKVASDGTAAFATTCLTIVTGNGEVPSFMNSYTVTPVYSPDGTGSTDTGYSNPDYASFTGSSISFTALSNPMVTISANPSSLNITAGSTATATLTISSLLGFGHAGVNGLEHNYSLPVQLQCDGLPAFATCSFSYPNPGASDSQSVNVGPAPNSVLPGTTTVCTVAMGCYGPGTVIMTISTSVPTGAVSSLRNSNKTVFAAMLGLGMLGLAFGRKKSLRERLMTMGSLVICCGVLAGINGCSTKQLGGSANVTPTPAGTYTVMVTARQVGSGPVSQGPPYTTYGSEAQVSLPYTMNVTIQ